MGRSARRSAGGAVSAAGREAYFRALLEAAPDAVVISDGDGRIVLVNARTEALFGYPRDALVGQPVEILVPQQLRDRHVSHRSTFIAAPRVRSMGEGLELYGRRADGSEFPVAISLSPVETGEGTLIVTTIRDVTFAKQAEQTIRDRGARFRALLEAAPDAMVIADAEGRIDLVNAQTEALFGYPRDQLIGQPVEILIPERFHARHIGHRRDYLAEPRMRSMGEGLELHGRRADGSEFPVAISLSPVETGEGMLTITAIRDVTFAKRAEQAIRDRGSRFRALLEAAPDAMVIADAEGRIDLVNAQTEALFGYPRDQLIGQPVEILVPERFHSRHVGHRQDYLAEPRMRSMGEGLELHGRRADGSEFPVAISLSPVETDEGTLIVSAIRDVSRTKQAEQQIKDLNDRLLRDNNELAAVNRELEAFSYSVSHDLRAPLRAIDGFSQALLEDCGEQLDAAGRGYLTRVRRAAQRMGLLIDDLIKLSRVTRADMRLQDVDLTALALQVVQDLQGRDPERPADFAIAEGLAAHGDARLLQIVLENLLGNAWKFTAGRAPTRIEFGRGESDGEEVFYLRDNGAGFDMAYVDQLFRVFQRLHDSESFPGTGIGLATVQRIIRKHGGRVWATGEAGKGAIFYFTL
jgi:PAS domain S-box-containing protein